MLISHAKVCLLLILANLCLRSLFCGNWGKLTLYSQGSQSQPSTNDKWGVAGLKTPSLAFPWWSSGQDCTLPVQQARVRSLVRELRSRVPCSRKQTKIQVTCYFLEVFLRHALTVSWCSRRTETQLPTVVGNWLDNRLFIAFLSLLISLPTSILVFFTL